MFNTCHGSDYGENSFEKAMDFATCSMKDSVAEKTACYIEMSGRDYCSEPTYAREGTSAGDSADYSYPEASHNCEGSVASNPSAFINGNRGGIFLRQCDFDAYIARNGL